MGRRTLSARLVLGAALLAAVAAQALGQTAIRPVTDADIQQPDPGEWLSWRRTLDSTGHSPLAEITPANVAALRLVWVRPLPPGHQEGTPLVRDGVMFFPGPADAIEALDAASGQLIWQYKRPLPADIGNYLPVYDTTRNVALYGNLVIGQSADNYLYALDAQTGKLVWQTRILDYRKGAKVSSGPIIADGLAITGRSCEPEGGPAACVIVAHDARTGREVWRTSTIAQGDDPNDASWGGVPLEKRQQVGAWMIPSYDPELGLVYVGTSVTAPAPKIALAGPQHDYLYHNSTLALDVKTGRIVWHYQHLRDDWDIDHTFARMLVDQQVAPDRAEVPWMAPDVVPGRTYRTLTGVPGKTGIVTTLDRATGKFLWARPTIRQNLVQAIDGASGRVTVGPATVPQRFGTTHRICPAPGGGANYMTGSYSPVTATLFLPMQATCADMIALAPGGDAAGTYAMSTRAMIDPEAGGLVGTIFAVDAVSGRTRWVHRQRAGMQSLLSTGSGLLFAGDADGRLMALDQRDGRELWAINLGSSITGYPISFALGGHQYLAVSTGRWLNDSYTPELTHGTQNALYVFALPDVATGARGPARSFVDAHGGLARGDPALAPAAFARSAKTGVFSAMQAQAGLASYGRNCAACHGADHAGGGGVPPVAGAAFMGKWRGKPVGDLFAYIRATMPPGAGKSLPDAEYLALTAHLLQANGYPAGPQGLEGDTAILATIGID